MIENLDPIEIGDRLRSAREGARLTQIDVADSLDVARTTIVAIEKGQRRPRSHELRKLARLYDTSVNTLLRREAVHVDLLPRFRKLSGSHDTATESAIELLSNMVKAETELENLLGVPTVRNYPPERSILPGDVRAQAETDALELRQWLGLGFRPIRDILTLLELDLGIRIYICKMDSKISGLFAYDDHIGACILLNSEHPPERRSQTAAHELGHFISTRKDPEIFQNDAVHNTRAERYATVFASNFLTPARTVIQMFQKVTAGSDVLSRRHIILLAHSFGVSREAMVRRLEELGLTKKGSWDWFQTHGGISNEQANEVLGDLKSSPPPPEAPNWSVPPRIGTLASEAYRQNLLSEGQLCNLLQLDRVEVRSLIDNVDEEGCYLDETPKINI